MTAMQEIWVWSLGQEDPLEEGMATHSNILLENSMDRGAWKATVHGLTKSWTWLSDYQSPIYIKGNIANILE